MPIGKNSISRVKKNGYTNVKTTAPDMEDSKIKVEKPAPVSKKEVSEDTKEDKKRPFYLDAPRGKGKPKGKGKRKRSRIIQNASEQEFSP